MKFSIILFATLVAITVDASPVETKAQPRVTITASNMPATWQVEAAEDLEIAFELEDTAYKSIGLLSRLFGSSHNEYNWHVVFNYDTIFYQAPYYIQFKEANDTILMFGRAR